MVWALFLLRAVALLLQGTCYYFSYGRPWLLVAHWMARAFHQLPAALVNHSAMTLLTFPVPVGLLGALPSVNADWPGPNSEMCWIRISMQSFGNSMFFLPPDSDAAAALDSFHRRMISVRERPFRFNVISLDPQVMTSCIFLMSPLLRAVRFPKQWRSDLWQQCQAGRSLPA